jgi:hypothetical protein
MNSSPSLASGLPHQHSGLGMSWLIEERRSSSVTKFSGTLQHDGSRQDPLSATIYAFSHFVLWHSKETRVFADLQGTLLSFSLLFNYNLLLTWFVHTGTLTNVNGVDIMMLFDIMSHTLDG